MSGSYASASRRNIGDFGPNERKDNIYIMDHQIKNNPDVADSGGIGTKPAGLKEERFVNYLRDILNSAVEPFNMPYLKHKIRLGGDSEQLLRLIDRRGHRFFDKHVDSVFQGFSCNLKVHAGWDDNAYGLGRRAVDEVVYFSKPWNAEIFSDRRCPAFILVHDPHKMGAEQFRVDSCVMLAKMAYSDHAYSFQVHGLFNSFDYVRPFRALT